MVDLFSSSLKVCNGFARIQRHRHSRAAQMLKQIDFSSTNSEVKYWSNLFDFFGCWLASNKFCGTFSEEISICGHTQRKLGAIWQNGRCNTSHGKGTQINLVRFKQWCKKWGLSWIISCFSLILCLFLVKRRFYANCRRLLFQVAMMLIIIMLLIMMNWCRSES